MGVDPPSPTIMPEQEGAEPNRQLSVRSHLPLQLPCPGPAAHPDGSSLSHSPTYFESTHPPYPRVPQSANGRTHPATTAPAAKLLYHTRTKYIRRAMGEKKTRRAPQLTEMVAGGLAGGTSRLFAAPFDLLKIRSSEQACEVQAHRHIKICPFVKHVISSIPGFRSTTRTR